MTNTPFTLTRSSVADGPNAWANLAETPPADAYTRAERALLDAGIDFTVVSIVEPSLAA